MPTLPCAAPDPAASAVRVLLVVVSVALGAALGWNAADDRRTESLGVFVDGAHGTARRIADVLSTQIAVTGSCPDGLTALGQAGMAPLLRQDPWGRSWSVRCHSQLGVVQSSGPDGVPQTVDDIIALAN